MVNEEKYSKILFYLANITDNEETKTNNLKNLFYYLYFLLRRFAIK
jgi:hypothetical protein